MPLAPVPKAASKIWPFNSLHHINNKKISAFRFRFKNVHAYSLTAFFELDVSTSPNRLQFQKRWDARSEPLWWSCVARKDMAQKRVVRSWASRRLRQAFTASLEKKGYAKDGTRIKGTDNESALYGTAQLTPELSSIKTSYEELVKQTDIAVLEMIRRQGEKEAQSSMGHMRPSFLSGRDKTGALHKGTGRTDPSKQKPTFRKVKR